MADFLTELKKVVKIEKELEVLEAARATAYSTAGQVIASKQAQVTKAKQDMAAAALI